MREEYSEIERLPHIEKKILIYILYVALPSKNLIHEFFVCFVIFLKKINLSFHKFSINVIIMLLYHISLKFN
jgi:hypothetical protein